MTSTATKQLCECWCFKKRWNWKKASKSNIHPLYI